MHASNYVLNITLTPGFLNYRFPRRRKRNKREKVMLQFSGIISSNSNLKIVLIINYFELN